MKKLIFVNGKFLSQPITGVQRYAWGVVRAWDDALGSGAIDPSLYDLRIVCPYDSPDTCGWKFIKVVRTTEGSSRFWEQVCLPFVTRGEMLFSPYAAAPILKRKHVVTIHDAGIAATPEQYSLKFRAYYGIVYRVIARNCTKVITVSEFSRREIHSYFGIPLEKIVAIHPGGEQIKTVPPDASILDRYKLSPRRYVLGVSSRSPIKNFSGLSMAWKRVIKLPGTKCVVAGGFNSSVFGKERQDVEQGIVRLGYVSDSQLRALYENAAVLVYPSFYEGFGLPPIEAMGCDCPVVVSSISALQEACGHAALYCDPHSPIDIAAKIQMVLDNPKLANDLRRRGREHVQRLTYRRCAAEIWSEIIKGL